MKLSEQKLFIVETGRGEGYSSQTLYVLAEGYDSAEQKALKHLEQQSMVGATGDLYLPDQVKVRSIKVASNELIW